MIHKQEDELLFEQYQQNLSKLQENITPAHMKVYNALNQHSERFAIQWTPASPAYIKQQLGVDVGIQSPEEFEQILSDLAHHPRIGAQFHLEQRSQGQMFFKFEPNM